MASQQRTEDGLARFGEPGVTLGPGTLYGSLTKLVERGMITALPSEDRRRPYEITEHGQAALAAQLETWSRIVDAARAKLSPA